MNLYRGTVSVKTQQFDVFADFIFTLEKWK